MAALAFAPTVKENMFVKTVAALAFAPTTDKNISAKSVSKPRMSAGPGRLKEIRELSVYFQIIINLNFASNSRYV